MLFQATCSTQPTDIVAIVSRNPPFCRVLQVVFATETLAAGINMPARSTVLGTISRRRDAMHALLQHNELLQMAGRAGRRGYDTIGALDPHAELTIK